MLLMKKQKNRLVCKALISIMLFALLFLPAELAANQAQAAEKPSITKEMTIGKGSIRGDSHFYSKSDYYTLEVYNPVKKASYSFASSDKSVVTIMSKGTKAYLTGVKAGTANITCQQKLNGKTTKVGSCKVTVKNAKIFSETYDGLPLGTGERLLTFDDNRNYDATYTFTSNSKDFTLKEIVKKEKGTTDSYMITQTYTAKKPGTYTVTVKETYNKKTTTVGKMEYIVKKATVIEKQTLYLGETAWAFYLINNYREDVDYFFDVSEGDIVEFYEEEGIIFVKAKKVGTATVKIYEDAKTPDDEKFIGSCNMTVKADTLESIETYFYSTKTYVGGDSIGFGVNKYPDIAPDVITVTSSNPKVATVSYYNADNYGEIKPVSKGTVTITVTCGKFTKTETITVYANEDEMQGW
jgi:hypothetical protein